MLTRERTESLIIELAAALDAALERGVDSARVRQHAAKFLADLRLGLLENDGRPVDLDMDASLFVHQGEELVQASLEGRTQIEVLRSCGAGGLSFLKGTDDGDLMKLIEFGLEVRGQVVELRRARTLLRDRGIERIRLLEASDEYEWAPVRSEATQSMFDGAGFKLSLAQPVYTSMAMAVEEAVEHASTGATVDMSVARSVGEQIREVGASNFEDLFHLGERPDFDAYTIQHSMRVALLATYVGTQLGLPPDVLTEIGAAGLMHDVGKGRIPHEVLTKPGKLEDDERRLLAEHPRLGAEILLESSDVSAAALGAAWGHHIRHDGRGYPEVPAWAARSRITSLVQVCDVFEALTARRSYKEPYSPARAYRILFADRGAFDQEVLAAFTRTMGLYPPGRFVRLSDGRTARVSRAGRALDRPVVRTIPDGVRVDLAEPLHAGLHIEALVDELTAVRDLSGDASSAPQGDPDSPDMPPAPLGSDPLPPEATEVLPHLHAADDDSDDHDCRLC